MGRYGIGNFCQRFWSSLVGRAPLPGEARADSGGTADVTVRGFDPGLVAIGLLLLLGACTALTVDVVRTTYGVKGDEATYVAMALSVVYDGDLVYDSRDIARLHEVYEGGPSGIFLKRGAGVHDRFDQLYFGKAYIYSVLAAPFVRLAGLNGMLLFHVVLLAGMVSVAYLFVAARSSRDVAIFFALAFFGVSVVPVHAVFLSPEIFNAACVSFAYFCWFYKEVAPPRGNRWTAWLWGLPSDLVGAVLLGLATFSKPSHALLIVPPVVLAAWRWRLGRSVLVGAVFVMAVVGCFAINAGITGEFNYQGGARKTFYGSYPFEHPGATFDNRGISMTTNEVDDEDWRIGFLSLLPTNLRYFLFGRHFGFLPFFFPGMLAVILFLARREWSVWQWSTLCVVALSVVILSGSMPYTWSGGGGPPGNRYFLSIYPALLFLTPPLASILPSIVAWTGGALFTAHIVMNPFVAAKQPYLNTERGLARALPVELTMVDDLPIALNRSRRRITYHSEPELLLALLDRNVQRSGDRELWVAGSSRTDVIVRSGDCLSSAVLRLRSPVANRVTVHFGGDKAIADLKPGIETRVSLNPSGIEVRGRWVYLLSVRTSAGFIPSFRAPGLRDERFLGAIIALEPHVERECVAD